VETIVARATDKARAALAEDITAGRKAAERAYGAAAAANDGVVAVQDMLSASLFNPGSAAVEGAPAALEDTRKLVALVEGMSRKLGDLSAAATARMAHDALQTAQTAEERQVVTAALSRMKDELLDAFKEGHMGDAGELHELVRRCRCTKFRAWALKSPWLQVRRAAEEAYFCASASQATAAESSVLYEADMRTFASRVATEMVPSGARAGSTASAVIEVTVAEEKPTVTVNTVAQLAAARRL
jgi:hypothetical protein